ncbi:MAG: amino acid adenylation domain-containing protein, partial [bacterium]|nr:amino acid adenylation domain-containing protein [bacterium]
FNIKLTPQQVFQHPTIAQMAPLIKDHHKQHYSPITATEKKEYYPLSHAQLRLWILSKLDKGSEAYNMPGSTLIEGELDTPALDNAFAALIHRHPMLRTTFTTIGGQPVQRTRFSPLPPIKPLAVSRAEIDIHAAQEAHTPFDLTHGPLMRVKCLTIADHRHLLLFTIHHIVSDGLSLDILSREMGILYEAYKQGQSPTLPPLNIRYQDYVNWEQELLREKSLQKLEEFWNRHLGGHISPLNLPTDQEGTHTAAAATFNGAHFFFKLSPEHVRRCDQLIKEYNITSYVFFLAIFNIFLSKICYQQDISVISGSSGRNHPDLEPLVGLFVRTFVIKNQIDPGTTFDRFLEQVLSRHLQVLEHDSYPFEKIIDRFAPGTGDRQAGNVHFIMSDRPRQNRLNLAKALLTLTVHEVNDTIEIDFEYNSDLFTAPKIKLLAAWYDNLLTHIIRHPRQEIAHYPLSSGTEKELFQYLQLQEEKIQAVYPMTPTQRDLFLNCRINPLEKIQRLTYYVSLHREVELLQWREKLIRLHRIYPILNARAAVKNEEYRLAIEKVKDVDIRFIDLCHENLTPAEVDKRVGELTRMSHSLEEKWIKHYLIKLSARHFISAVSAHHIIFDGISAALFFNALSADEETLSSYEHSHQQYIRFHNQQDRRFDTPAVKTYWREKFSDIEKLRSSRRTGEESQRIFRQAAIDEDTLRQIEDYCKNNRISIPLYFRGLYGLMIRLYCSAGGDFLLREIIDARDETNQSLLGCYYSALPLVFNREIFDGATTLKQFFQYVRSQRKELGENQNISIFLQNQLSGEEEIAFYYNFQTFFQLERRNSTAPARIKDIMYYSPKEIHLLAAETGDGFRLKLTYDSTHFDGPLFLERLLHVSQQVIRGVPTQAGLRWMMPEEEEAVLRPPREDIGNDFNGDCLQQLFQRRVEQNQDRTAMVFSSLHLSYRQLNRLSNRLAHYLQENRGTGRGHLVGITAGRSEIVVIAMLGILKAGAAYVPVDTDYPPDRIDFMLKDSGVSVTLEEDLLKDIIFDRETNHQDPACVNRAHDPAYVLYTSGSTGRSKGVIVEHRNLLALFQTGARMFDFDARDVWTMFHSPCFDFSVWEMYGALLFGGKLIVIPAETARDTGAYLEVVKREAVTVLNQTPPAFYNLMAVESQAEKPGITLNRLKYIIFGGDALNPGKLGAWKKRYPDTRLINMFGITETTVHVTFKEIGHGDITLKSSNIGSPLRHMRALIVDNELRPLPVGIAGEILVGGSGVAGGYLNQPLLSLQKFIHHPSLPGRRFYRSGDRVRLLPSGEMEYLGRVDHQVQLRGFRVEPGEIENCLLGHRDAAEAVVLVKDTKKGDKRLYAYATVSSSITEAELKNFLKNALPGYMVPDRIVLLEEFPLTANGKIDRKGLPDPEMSVTTAGENSIEGEVEWRLTAIWADLLGIERERIGPGSDFFQLGGHSLNAVKLVLAIQKESGVKIPLQEVFERPFIGDMARYIRAAEKKKRPGPEVLEKQEYYHLSPAQERLFIFHKMSPDSTAYNLPAAFRLEGTPDVEKLEEIFNTLIARHASLRTCFPLVKDVPVQRVLKNVTFEISMEKSIPVPLDIFVQSFDLSRAPLLRVGLFSENGENHVLAIDIHHIVADGISLAILVREFVALYRGESLDRLKIGYMDYTGWLKGIKSDPAPWLKMFEREPEPLNLPLDFSRPPVWRHEGESVSFDFAPAAAASLEESAREKDMTVYMLLLALFNVLLAKLSGMEDIVVGTPVANRGHADLQGVVGMFVNTLAMRNFPEGKKSFEDFLQEVKVNTLTAFENQDYP